MNASTDADLVIAGATAPAIVTAVQYLEAKGFFANYDAAPHGERAELRSWQREVEQGRGLTRAQRRSLAETRLRGNEAKSENERGHTMKKRLWTALAVLLLGAPVLHAKATYPKTMDLAEDRDRHVIIAAGDADTYHGHPTTLLLPNGKTMYCVWTYDHGGACGPLKRSDDGGRTWSNLLDVPSNWTTVRNCPSLYRLTDPEGTTRLFVFAGQGPDGTMHQSYSMDEGRTWTAMQSNGLTAVMPFCTIVPIDGGRRLLAQTNIRRPGETEERNSNVLAQSVSNDGGLTCRRFVSFWTFPVSNPASRRWCVRRTGSSCCV